MIRPEKIPDEERWLDAIERRIDAVAVLIGDKRDAAKYHRRTGEELDRDADRLLDESNALKVYRTQLEKKAAS